MKKFIVVKVFIIIFALLITTETHSEVKYAVNEEFENLDNWKEVFFEKIKTHSIYTIDKSDSVSALKLNSDSSASALVYKNKFDIYNTPNIEFSWKINKVIHGADGSTKVGDDYPVRIYIMFEYDPVKSGIKDKAVFNTLKYFYGEYPPESSLNYVWSNIEYKTPMINSPYTDRVKVLFLNSGNASAGKWIVHTRNVLDDYKKFFKKNPPKFATLGIMIDTDNTGKIAESYIDYIRIY